MDEILERLRAKFAIEIEHGKRGFEDVDDKLFEHLSPERQAECQIWRRLHVRSVKYH